MLTDGGLAGVRIRGSSGGNNRFWRLTARPTTTTTEATQHLDGKVGVQISYDRLGSEDAVTYPTPQALLINVGHVFVWHRCPPRPSV
jgi:hypothetical protein